MQIIDIQDLQVEFSGSGAPAKAVENISFSVDSGETVALVGESGSGKSVTALSLLRLLPAATAIYKAGRIIFREPGGNQVNMLEADERTLRNIRGNRIGMIFQEPMTSLNPVLTCGQQIAESLIRHRHLSPRAAKKDAVDWFAQVKLQDPSAMMNRYPHQLSGGQKQRVMIAMAICCRPALLICDEPTTALDVTVQQAILELISDLKAQMKMGVIFITHDLGLVAEIADRAIVMYKGRIVEQNSVNRLFLQPSHPYTRALLACRPSMKPKGTRLPVVSDFWEPGDESAQGTAVITEPDNRNPGSPLRSPDSFPSETLLSVNNLTVRFDSAGHFPGTKANRHTAVRNVSFSVFRGETLGLVGESGCGKTSLGRAILRLVQPVTGSIIFRGKDLTLLSGKELRSVRKEMQVVFQDPYSSLNPRLTIGNAIIEPMAVHGIGRNPRERKEMAIDLLKKVGLVPGHFSRYPHEFSGGQRQRIVIARALALRPSFVICDESVSALDISVQAQVLNLLNDLKSELGFTVIFISHDLSVVRYVSDRIMVMQSGEIVESGTAEEVFGKPATDYTRKLIQAIPGGLPA